MQSQNYFLIVYYNRLYRNRKLLSRQSLESSELVLKNTRKTSKWGVRHFAFWLWLCHKLFGLRQVVKSCSFSSTTLSQNAVVQILMDSGTGGTKGARTWGLACMVTLSGSLLALRWEKGSDKSAVFEIIQPGFKSFLGHLPLE